MGVVSIKLTLTFLEKKKHFHSMIMGYGFLEYYGSRYISRHKIKAGCEKL